MTRTLLRWVIAVFFVAAGINHFVMPGVYLGMMPDWVPAPGVANSVAGLAEILGGAGLLVPARRKAACWGLVALLIAVFPANVHVALRGHMDGFAFSQAFLWLRLPFQAVFIAGVLWTGLFPDRR